MSPVILALVGIWGLSGWFLLVVRDVTGNERERALAAENTQLRRDLAAAVGHPSARLVRGERR